MDRSVRQVLGLLTLAESQRLGSQDPPEDPIRPLNNDNNDNGSNCDNDDCKFDDDDNDNDSDDVLVS